MMTRDELLTKGARARLHELTTEVRELLGAFQDLPRVITINMGAEARPASKPQPKKKYAADRTRKRLATMTERYGTTNPRLIKQAKLAKAGANGSAGERQGTAAS